MSELLSHNANAIPTLHIPGLCNIILRFESKRLCTTSVADMQFKWLLCSNLRMESNGIVRQGRGGVLVVGIISLWDGGGEMRDGMGLYYYVVEGENASKKKSQRKENSSGDS